MKLHNSILGILVLVPLFCGAKTDLLKKSINDYSKKIETCNEIVDNTSIEHFDVKVVSDVLIENPKILSYLSELAFSQCLQPERRMLAEEILFSLNTKDDSSTLKLANSTREMIFNSRENGKDVFDSLDGEQKIALFSVIKLQQPFNAIKLLDKLMASRDNHTAM